MTPRRDIYNRTRRLFEAAHHTTRAPLPANNNTTLRSDLVESLGTGSAVFGC